MSRGICTKCKSTDNYNFVINNGLCDPCIAERLDELQAELASANHDYAELQKERADYVAENTRLRAVIALAIKRSCAILAKKRAGSTRKKVKA